MLDWPPRILNFRVTIHKEHRCITELLYARHSASGYHGLITVAMLKIYALHVRLLQLIFPHRFPNGRENPLYLVAEYKLSFYLIYCMTLI